MFFVWVSSADALSRRNSRGADILGEDPKDWLSANYKLRFEYDLLSVFTCYKGHHATNLFDGARFAANCLVVNTGQFSVWCGDNFGHDARMC